MAYQSFYGGGGTTAAPAKSSGGGGYSSYYGTKQGNISLTPDKAPAPNAPKFMPAAKQSLLGKARSFVSNQIVKPTVNTAEKAANTVAAGAVGGAGLTKAVVQDIGGNNKGANQTAAGAQKTMNTLLSHGAGNAGAYVTPQEAVSNNIGTRLIKPVTKAVADIAPLVTPVGSEVKGASLLEKAGKTAAANAVVGAGSTAASEAVNGKVKAKDVVKGAAYGGVLGATNEIGAEGLIKGEDAVKAKTSNPDSKLGKVDNNVRAVAGSSVPAKNLIQSQRTQTLLHYEPKNPKVQALIADREKQAESMAAPAKAAEAEQNRVANETEKTQATGQKIDRQIELIKAKGKDSDTGLSNVDKTKLGHLQEDKKQLPTASTPTVEKVGNDVTPAKTSVAVEPVAKPASASPSEVTPAKTETPSPASVEPKSESSVNSSPKAAEVSKPTTQANVPGDTGTSKIAQDIQTKAVAKNLTDNYGELSQYSKINVADEAKKAVDFVNGDKDTLDKVISGEKPLPSNLRATAVIKAVEEHPEYGKSGEMLKSLAKSPLNTESSRSAQELRLAAERDTNSATNKINELDKTRSDAFKAKSGKTVAKASSDEVKQIRAAVPRAKVTKETFSSFVDSLRC